MFGYMNPEVMMDIIKKRNDSKFNKDEFYSYFNKKYLESIKDFLDNPKFSMKYFMVMANIRETIFEKCKNEYIEKYNLSPDFFTRNKITSFPVKNNNDTRSDL